MFFRLLLNPFDMVFVLHGLRISIRARLLLFRMLALLLLLLFGTRVSRLLGGMFLLLVVSLLFALDHYR